MATTPHAKQEPTTASEDRLVQLFRLRDSDAAMAEVKRLFPPDRPDLEVARYFLAIGADPNIQGEEDTPLMCAARDCGPEIVADLINAGASRGMLSALRDAVLYGECAENIEVLVKQGGVSPNDRLVDCKPPTSDLILNQAVDALAFRTDSHDELVRNVRMLIEMGADPDLVDHNGKTARALAVEAGLPNEQLDLPPTKETGS
ncbi:hypothetical protein DFJ73DRAFT_777305 [Zopfochytrium polystomum]|nr:hypothetical protein DFJ73DRAFT_777305 [Zopfochytrium polystomum]